MKWVLSAFPPFLVDGLELSEQVTLLSPRNICSPVQGCNTAKSRAVLVSQGCAAQKAASGHQAPLPACPKALVHPVAKPEAPS